MSACVVAHPSVKESVYVDNSRELSDLRQCCWLALIASVSMLPKTDSPADHDLQYSLL